MIQKRRVSYAYYLMKVFMLIQKEIFGNVLTNAIYVIKTENVYQKHKYKVINKNAKWTNIAYLIR